MPGPVGSNPERPSEVWRAMLGNGSSARVELSGLAHQGVESRVLCEGGGASEPRDIADPRGGLGPYDAGDAGDGGDEGLPYGPLDLGAPRSRKFLKDMGLPSSSPCLSTAPVARSAFAMSTPAYGIESLPSSPFWRKACPRHPGPQPPGRDPRWPSGLFVRLIRGQPRVGQDAILLLEVSRSHQPCWHPCPPEPALHPRGIRHSALRRNNWKTGVAILPGTGPFPWPCAASIQLPEAWDHCPDASGTEKPWQVRPSGRACSSLAGTGLIARDGHPHETPGSRRTDGAGERWQAACGYVVLCHNMQRTCQLMNES